MKKIFSLALAVIMLVSAVPMVYAAETTDAGNGTDVTYTNAEAREAYTVTVPATLAPGGSGDVVASGTWGSNRKLMVKADQSVELINSINESETRNLDVTFPGIALRGNNTAAVTDTKAVSVAGIDNILFGTWEGTFFYNVYMTYADEAGYATFSDGKKLTWDKLRLDDNGAKYGYDAEFVREGHLYAFDGCETLTSIRIPEGETMLSDSTCYGCPNLTSIIIPDSVTSAGECCFCDCPNLTDITFNGTMAQWNAIPFDCWFENVPATVVHCIDGDVTL